MDQTTSDLRRCTAFAGTSRLAAGDLLDVALAVKAAGENGAQAAILIFDDATGKVVDLDLRGTAADIAGRLAPAAAPLPLAPAAPARGRPRLGVVAREVTLLPRHWEWLAGQPGGASAALRRLVDQARRGDEAGGDPRAARERGYRFLAAIAGDLPGYEEALRALFAGDAAAFAERTAGWPGDVHDHAQRLAFG
jgi:hypothetical protein